MVSIEKNSKEKNAPYFLVITENNDNQRIDNFLTTQLKGLPRDRLYRILRKGEVRVNKKRIKPSYRLQEGDSLRIPPLSLAPPTEPSVPSDKIIRRLENSVLYEDTQLLCLNKPSGVAVHGGSGISLGVIETMRYARPRLKFLELVHRLDRDTSGCLILAKKPSILKELHGLLVAHKVQKKYLVLVHGNWDMPQNNPDGYLVDAPLLKGQSRSGDRIVRVDPAGKTAQTVFRLVKQFQDFALLEATLLTGRTHQIRVHACHIGYPIVGDNKYGDNQKNNQRDDKNIKRLFLHASNITFNLAGPPERVIKIDSPLDQELTDYLESLPS